jgi:hypothetical protein
MDLDTQHHPPPYVSVVELTVDLIQLILQPEEGDVSENHEQMLEQNVFNIVTLNFDDNKVLKVKLDMLIFVQVCKTID